MYAAADAKFVQVNLNFANILLYLNSYRVSELSLPNATVVEFTVHCQTRLKSKVKGTVNSCLFLTVIRDANICSLFQNVQGT